MIDDEHLDRSRAALELQAKLLLDGREDRGNCCANPGAADNMTKTATAA
jgi:hypothetical protein